MVALGVVAWLEKAKRTKKSKCPESFLHLWGPACPRSVVLPLERSGQHQTGGSNGLRDLDSATNTPNDLGPSLGLSFPLYTMTGWG